MSQRRPRGSGKRKRGRAARPPSPAASLLKTELPAPDDKPPPTAAESPSRNETEAAVLGATRAPNSRPRDLSRSHTHPEIPLSAALFTFGVALALIRTLDELRFHLSPQAALGVVGALFFMGVVLGLLLPHRIITPRIRGVRNAASPGEVGMRLEFAASLAGGTLVGFGLSLGLLASGAAFMESLRGGLLARFAYPPALTLTMLCLPLAACIVFVGMGVSVLLAVLHGWRRVSRQPDPKPANLWIALSIGAMAAGFVGLFFPAPLVLTLLPPLALFLAGLSAVARRTREVGLSPPASTWRVPSREELVALGGVSLASAAVAAAVCLSSTGSTLTLNLVSRDLIVAALAAVTGLTAGRVPSLFRAFPVYLLICAASLLLPCGRRTVGEFDPAAVRLFLTTAAATACLTLTATRMGGPSQNLQRSLSWIGGAVAVGAGCVFLLAAFKHAAGDQIACAATISVVCAAAAVLMLFFKQEKLGRRHAIILGASAFWLFLTLAAIRELSRASNNQTPAPPPVAAPLAYQARKLVSTDAFRREILQWPHADQLDSPTWRFDLAGPALDLIVIERCDEPLNAALAPGDCRRLLKRLSRRMVHGGRLLVELPTTNALLSSLEKWPAGVGERSSPQLLTLRDEYGEFKAVAYGGDIVELVERNRRLCPAAVALEDIPPLPEE